MVSLHTDPKSISARLRMQRMAFLDGLIRGLEKPELSLVDLGGTFSFWEMNLQHLECRDRLVRIECDEIRLLTRKEIKLLFPKTEIHAERLGGLVKSFIVSGETQV